MESNDELIEINITNCTCYYFDDIIKVGDFDCNNNLFDEKSYDDLYENILIYDILCKTLMSEKPLRIRFNKVDGFIKIYDANGYLVLFRPERYYTIYDKIKCLISIKSGFTYGINHNFWRIRIDSHNSLPIKRKH